MDVEVRKFYRLGSRWEIRLASCNASPANDEKINDKLLEDYSPKWFMWISPVRNVYLVYFSVAS